jgi:hypothetical protein
MQVTTATTLKLPRSDSRLGDNNPTERWHLRDADLLPSHLTQQ